VTGPPRVALVGAYGYGRSHLDRILAMQARGVVELVGVSDVRSPTKELATVIGVPWYADPTELFHVETPDMVVVATPIHTHERIASAALAAGADVLVEKPPTPSLAAYVRLSEVVRRTGGSCQVGFQVLGSAALSRARTLVAAGAIGKVRGVGVFGAWLRDEEYWKRAPWAGRRRLDGRPVMDGALTNPFAHGLAAALHLAGTTRIGQVAEVQTELFRANDIDTDDTSCVRVTCHGGPTVLAAVSLCADRDHEPTVSVFGSRGSLRLAYNEDRLLIRTPTQSAERTLPRVDLLDNLVAHRRDRSVPLIADLEQVGGFMQVLEAIRLAPEPVRIIAPHAEVIGTGDGRHHVVRGVSGLAAKASRSLRTFSEIGVPWAAAPR
jgi:predicted dehydrogenase